MGRKIKITVAIILIFCVSTLGVFLGSWQLQRLSWKNSTIEKLEHAYNKPQAIELDFIEEKNPDYFYGTISGQFDYSNEIFLGPMTHQGKIVKQVITPLRVNNRILYVARGYIPVDNINGYIPPKKKQTRITGLLKQPKWNDFTSDNSPQNNVWVKPDIEEITKFYKIKNAMSYILYASAITPADDALIMPNEKWFPRNKHAQYAAFWFSMSGILILFFGVLFFRRKQSL